MADLLRLTACSRVSRFDIFNCSDFFDFPSSVPRKINDLGDPRTAHGMRVGKIISEALVPWLRHTLPAALLFTRAHIRNAFAKGGGEVYLMVLLVN